METQTDTGTHIQRQTEKQTQIPIQTHRHRQIVDIKRQTGILEHSNRFRQTDMDNRHRET